MTRTQAVIALCPALAATIANVAGPFLAANAVFSTSFGGGGSSNPGGFASQSQLLDYFARHGSDFGARTAAEYELQANSFLNGLRARGVLEKVRANGDIVRYNPATEEFGVVRADGTIRTYYKPNPAVHGKPTNLDYFNAQ